MTVYGLIRAANVFIPAMCLVGFMSCGQRGVSGPQTRLKLAIGQIKEVTLPVSSHSTRQLVATSDNSEIVDVSPKEVAAGATGTLKSPTNTFLIKGVTAGTARVVFTENQADVPGPGPIRKAYSVRVIAE